MNCQCKRFLKRSAFLVELLRSQRALMRSLRYDMSRLKWFWYRSQQIKKYAASHTVRKLQLGSGDNYLKDWLNTDLYPRSKDYICMDATRQFPFGDSTFDYLFSEHLIEHFTYEAGEFMLKECYRVLKSGGKIRISTPSLEQLAGLFKPRPALAWNEETEKNPV